MLYFLIPFGIAISIMGTRELWLNVVLPWQERRRLSEACPASAAVPQPVKSRSRRAEAAGIWNLSAFAAVLLFPPHQ